MQVTIDIYASAEFGCVTIGERNRVEVPNDVQVGCEMRNECVPIVNTTRHWLRYCIEVNGEHHSVNNELMEFPSTGRRCSWDSLVEQEIDGEENGVESEIGDGSENDGGLEKDDGPENENENESEGGGGPKDDDESSSTMMNRSSDIYSITSSMTSPTKFGRQSSMWRSGAEKTTPWPFVFEFDSLVGELGPNERRNLRLSFRPTANMTYTADATCYLTCDRDDYPKIVNALPVTIEGTGCRTLFQVSKKPSPSITVGCVNY